LASHLASSFLLSGFNRTAVAAGLLLLEANTVVSLRRLMTDLWGEIPTGDGEEPVARLCFGSAAGVAG
jgi:hypothetical protein